MFDKVTTFDDFKLSSKKLGRDFVVTERDLRILGYLYTYLRLDLDQLLFLDNVTESNKKRFRARLLVLSNAGCIHTFTGSIRRPPIFALLDRGMNILLKARALEQGIETFTPRRITRPRHTDAEKIRRHEMGISDLALIQSRSAAKHPTGFFVEHRDIFHGASNNSVRSHHKWPVPVVWNGQANDFYLEPDYIAGTGFTDRPAGKNVRYFAYEIDCSSETLKPNRPLARGQSILRKLLTYEVTVERDLLAGFLGIEQITPLFLFESEVRRGNAVKLAQEVLTSRRAKDQILFGTRPQRLCEGAELDFATLSWVNGRGKETFVRL